DGAAKDVTGLVLWTSSDPSSLSVSPSGVVTVLRFGSSYIHAAYNGKFAALNIQATPPGTFVAAGRVREPGSSGIQGVVVREEVSGVSALSASGGEFSIG